MVKKIALVATDGYEDLELHYPRIRLIEAGYNTELISLSMNEIIGNIKCSLFFLFIHGIKEDLT